MAGVGDVHTHDATSTEHYSNPPEEALEATSFNDGCRCTRIGSSVISFSPALRGSNVIAFGPILPVIPVPGSTDYSDSSFFLAVHIDPGTYSLVMLDLSKFLVRAEGSDIDLEPHLISRCDDSDPGLDAVQVYGGYKQCFKLQYPATRGEMEHFTLLSPTIEADRNTYTLPDIEWTPSTYRWIE